MEPVSWLKPASDKLKKPDNRSRKEAYNRYFDNSQRLLRSVQVWILNPTPLHFPYQQRHALTCLSASSYPTYQRKAFTTTSLRLAYKKIVSAFVLVRALGSLRLNLTCPMDTRAFVYKALFVSGVQGLFWLPVWQTQWWKVWRCGEDCMWALVQPESCWCSLAIIYQRGCMSGLHVAGFPSIWMSPPECCFWTVSAWFGVLAEDVIAESFLG